MEFITANLLAIAFLVMLVFLIFVAYQMRHRYSIIAEFIQFLKERKLW